MGTLSTEILTHSPLAYWRLGESSGGMVDAAGNLSDGTYSNSPTLGETGISDDADTAVLFDGVDQYASVSAGSQLSGATAFSVNLFVKESATPSIARTLFLWRINTTNSVQIYQQSDGAIRVELYNNYPTTWGFYRTDSAVDISEWTMLTVTYSAGTLVMYVDGAAVAASYFGDTITSLPTGSPTYYLAAFAGLNSFFEGTLDEVAVFSNVLTATDVSDIYDLMEIPLPAEEVTLSAPIFLNTVPRVRLFAPIRLRTSESVTLTAPINLNTRAVALSAAISLQTKESVSLSAPINVVSLTPANTNRATGKWSVAVYVDGTDVSARLTGTIEIEQGEDISSLAFFTILPEPGPVTPANYIGNRVRIDFIDIDTDDNVLYQLTRFVGFVSDPLYDPATGELYMQCTSDLQGTLDNAPRSYIDALTPTATWSPYVFDEGAQGWDYASDRIRTIPGSMWHGPSGIVITDWAAKTTADFEFTDDEMFECGPYAPGTRRDLLNTISASFDFRYKRKRQRTLGVKWETMQTFCSFLINGFTLCQRRMVESAASGAGWVLQGDIQYIDLPPAGYYTCFPFASGGQSSKVIGWGNLTLGQLSEDPDNQALCWGASWRAAKRWAQTVTEHYTIVMSAAQSVAGNGEIGSIESYRLETSEDFDEWVKALDYSTADPVTDGYEDVGGGQADGDYILGDVAKDVTDDTLTGRAAANTARSAIIASGTSDILAAHRQNQATLVVPFQPQVNPTHTVRAVSAHITFKGKIGNMRDVWDIDTGDAVTEITVALSRHEGTGLVTPSPLTPEDPPEKTTEEGIPTTLRLLTYVGGRNDVAELTGDEQGYFTNWIYDPTETEPFATDPTNPDAIIYPEQFVVEYPEVSGGAVDAIELPATQNIDVEIPVDELTLTQ